jgi:hypothetical protein
MKPTMTHLRPLKAVYGRMEPGGDWTYHLFVMLPCGCCWRVVL